MVPFRDAAAGETAERTRRLFISPEFVALQGRYNVARIKQRFTLEPYIDMVDEEIIREL